MSKQFKVTLESGEEVIVNALDTDSETDALRKAAQRDAQVASDPVIAEFLKRGGMETPGQGTGAGRTFGLPGAPVVPQGPSRTQQLLRGMAVGASALPALAVPGAGLGSLAARIGLEAVGPMAAETLLGGTGGDVAMAGLTPMATRSFLATPGMLRGGARGIAQFVAPQQIRQAGIAEAQQFFQGPKAEALFTLARNAGNAPTMPTLQAINKAITKESGMSTPSHATIKLLSNLRDKLPVGGTIGYDDLIDEVQRLTQHASSAFKKGNNVTGHALSNASKTIINSMDSINPAWKEANKAWRLQNAAETLTKALRTSNPADRIRNILDFDELTSGVFTSAQKTELKDIADRLGRTPSQTTMGAANRFIAAVTEPLQEGAQEPIGQELTRFLMRSPRKPIVPRTSAVIGTQAVRGGLFGGERE